MNTWTVLIHPDFEGEIDAMSLEVQDELYACATVLMECGPGLGRPKVDTLNGSKHANMKEFRFSANKGVWRMLFAFDVNRNAILLIAGDKRGKNQRQFYDRIVTIADSRFDKHLANLEVKS